MKKFKRVLLFTCGLLLTLATFPVFAQMQEANVTEINKKPFDDFTKYFNEKIGDEKTDLNAEFLVSLEGILDKEGKLDLRKSKFVRREGDERLIEIAKIFIEALGASGVFGHLKNHGAEKIDLTLAQNDVQLYCDIVLEQKSPERAKSLVRGFDTLISVLLLAEKKGIQKLDDNSKLLISGAKVDSEGNNAVLKFAFQKTVVQNLINQNLKQRKLLNQ